MGILESSTRDIYKKKHFILDSPKQVLDKGEFAGLEREFFYLSLLSHRCFVNLGLWLGFRLPDNQFCLKLMKLGTFEYVFLRNGDTSFCRGCPKYDHSPPEGDAAHGDVALEGEPPPSRDFHLKV